MSAFRLFCELWHHRDMPVVIDDVDSLYTDKNAIRLLKCLCQTEAVKTVGWHTNTMLLNTEGIPREFQTRTRVAIIANEWKTLNRNVGAVQDRGILIHFQPSPEEVHERVGAWFNDREVYDFVGSHIHMIAEASMRDYVNASSAKQAGLDWQEALMTTWGFTEKERLAARLKMDPAFTTEQQRVAAFKACGGGSRATYFRVAKRLALNGKS